MSWGYKRQPEDGSWMEFIDVDVCEISGSKFAGNMSDCWKPTWISWAKRESRTIKSVSAFRDHSGHIPTTGVELFFFANFTAKVDRVVRRERLHAALAQLDAMPAMMNDLEKTSGLKGGWDMLRLPYVGFLGKKWIFSYLRNFAPGRWRSCRKKRQSRRRRCHNCDSKPTKRAPTWRRARLDSGRFLCIVALFPFVSWSLFFN